ncbi:hypothetical protein [Streptomyces sp. NPDC001137]|uniref:hypothetical protein n=1 Tax=Streptomyces sp. NPDC001137 TaxID=3154378 RepID=UPI00333293CD
MGDRSAFPYRKRPAASGFTASGKGVGELGFTKPVHGATITPSLRSLISGHAARGIGGRAGVAGGKDASPRREKVGPEARAYGAALAACLRQTGATQRDLARFTYLSEAAVSNYLSGVRIAPQQFVDRLRDFAISRGIGSGTPCDVEHLHALRRAAQKASRSAEVRLAVAKEEIERLTTQLNDLQHRYNAGPRSRVHDLEQKLRDSEREVRDLRRQLESVEHDLEAERKRAELSSAGARIALGALVLSNRTASPRPQQDIARDLRQAEALLGRLDGLHELVHQLTPGRGVRADASAGEGTDSAAITRDVPGGFLRRTSASRALRWRQHRPLQIYSRSAAGLSTAVLSLNLSAFVATWRADTGLTLGQLNAYVVLVFPVGFGVCVFLVWPSIERARRSQLQADVYRLLATCAGAALVIGIAGSFLIPPVSWVGRAWAGALGLL